MWGCTCGRLCDPGDRFCAGCGAPRDKGTPVAGEDAKKAFLRKAEISDARALRGVRQHLRGSEKAFQDVEDAFDRHQLASYDKFDGWFGEWLRDTSGRVDHYGMPLNDDWDDYDDFE